LGHLVNTWGLMTGDTWFWIVIGVALHAPQCAGQSSSSDIHRGPSGPLDASFLRVPRKLGPDFGSN
jgi:hypothetical protein